VEAKSKVEYEIENDNRFTKKLKQGIAFPDL